MMGSAPTPAEHGVEVQLAWRGDAPSVRSFRAWAEAALGRVDTAVCVRVVDETEGRDLNQRFRRVAKATNVLSFPAAVPGLLGDIAVCGPVVEREAAEQGKSVADHFAHLVVHGVLHLTGMDHENDVEAAAMEAREIEILLELGIANPYES